MVGHKNYLQPVDMLLNGIHDLAALLKAETVSSDSAHKTTCLRIEVYGEKREYRFEVEEITGKRACAHIEVAGDGEDIQRLIDHGFAFLDYVLIDRAKIDLVEQEEWSRMLAEEQKALQSNA